MRPIKTGQRPKSNKKTKMRQMSTKASNSRCKFSDTWFRVFLHDFGTKSRFSFWDPYAPNPGLQHICMILGLNHKGYHILHCSHGKKSYGNMSIEKLSPFHVNKIIMEEAPSLGKIRKFTCRTPMPHRKRLGRRDERDLDFCIFLRKKELWKYTARRDADFYRPMPNLFLFP